MNCDIPSTFEHKGRSYLAEFNETLGHLRFALLSTEDAGAIGFQYTVPAVSKDQGVELAKIYLDEQTLKDETGK